jgi:hypothetical protein
MRSPWSYLGVHPAVAHIASVLVGSRHPIIVAVVEHLFRIIASSINDPVGAESPGFVRVLLLLSECFNKSPTKEILDGLTNSGLIRGCLVVQRQSDTSSHAKARIVEFLDSALACAERLNELARLSDWINVRSSSKDSSSPGRNSFLLN